MSSLCPIQRILMPCHLGPERIFFFLVCGRDANAMHYPLQESSTIVSDDYWLKLMALEKWDWIKCEIYHLDAHCKHLPLMHSLWIYLMNKWWFIYTELHKAASKIISAKCIWFKAFKLERCLIRSFMTFYISKDMHQRQLCFRILHFKDKLALPYK